ncbi:MAG: phosphate ABC transporter ATP-binding protein [Candidatus Binatia bacterium]
MNRGFFPNIENPAETTPTGSFTVGNLQSGPPCCDPAPCLEVRGLSVRYQGVSALQDVSLDVHRGCVTALIGPSGCGKTTLLSSLNRLTDLIPGCSVSGRIAIDGIDIHAPSTNLFALRRKVGMVFQKPNPFPLSVRRNLDLPLREAGVAHRSDRDAIAERVLRDVGLWDELDGRLDRSAVSLSGGQQQRLCIARALALEPSILLMDEPCSALDPIASEVVEELILGLAGRYTVVLVTHNLAQARRVANFAAFFWMRERSGRLIEFGRCRQIFESPKHELTAAYVRGARG